MNNKLEGKLIKNFPKIFVSNKNRNEPFRLFGFECDDGWYELIYNLCEKIQKECNDSSCDQVVAAQVKEKFGTLRFYYIGGNDIINKLVMEAEDKSKYLCELTGNKGVLCKRGAWYKTLCQESATLLEFKKI